MTVNFVIVARLSDKNYKKIENIEFDASDEPYQEIKSYRVSNESYDAFYNGMEAMCKKNRRNNKVHQNGES